MSEVQSDFRWYMVSVLPDWEDRVAKEIADNLRARGLADKVKHILVPKEEVPEEELARTRRGKPRSRFRPVYRGYVTVLADLDSVVWYVIMNTRPGVIGLVGSARKAAPMPPKDVVKVLIAAGWLPEEIGRALQYTDFFPHDHREVAELLVRRFGVQQAGDALLAANLSVSEVAQALSGLGGRPWQPPGQPASVTVGDTVRVGAGPAAGQIAEVVQLNEARRRARIRLLGEGFLIRELEVSVDVLEPAREQDAQQ